MSASTGQIKRIFWGMMILALCLLLPQALFGQPCAVDPAAGGVTVLPNVLVIFDNSGSMTEYAYDHGTYDPSSTYSGIFDPAKRYNYNSTGAYFEEASGGSWSGNFLNWACMLRIDVARKVMTGGKVITVSGNTYVTANNYSMDAPEFTYNDTTDQTPWPGSYKYKFINNTSYEWGQLRVRNSSNTTVGTYNIRIRVETGYVVMGILHDLEGKVRLGLMHFNGTTSSTAEGGYIRRYVQKLTATHLANIVSDLNRDLGSDYNWSYTPLAETLYNATRYFAQVPSYYNSGDYTVGKGTINDPLYNEDYGGIVWCAKNYVILLTDGESTADQNIPTSLRDYDGDSCDPCPCSCAGYSCSCPLELDGTAYLDDIAKYAYDTDLRDGPGEPPGKQNITLYAVYMFGQPGWADVLLRKAAEEKGKGKYFLATDADTISSSLQTIFKEITMQAAAAASTAITSEPVEGSEMIYVPYYKHPQEDQWWGNVRAFRLSETGLLLAGSSGETVALDVDGDLVLDDPKWDAIATVKTKAEANSRTIYTYIPGETNPLPFTTSRASTIGPYLDVDLDKDGIFDEVGSDQEVNALISYIRGNDSPSGFTGSLRARQGVYVGDIMHASPIFVSAPGARYDKIYGDESYWKFYWDNKYRTPVLYAAANDGMVHCFRAETGEELWSFIPHNLLPHLKWLADKDYCHCYYVDLTANIWDIKLSGGWRSVLIGGMRIGGTPVGVDADNNGTTERILRSAIFALDVTDPDPGEIRVMWEINDERFGYTISRPIPVRVGGTWYLVFGSGPKSRDGEGAPASPGDGYPDNNGYIFVVNPNNGNIVRAISLGSTWGPGNFFGSPVAIDYDRDYNVDMIYIGDAVGNLWRLKTFTESGTPLVKTYQTDPNNWSIDVTGSTSTTDPQPLLSLGADQPILLKPSVSMDEHGRTWIFLGAGRYFCANDNLYCNIGNRCPTTGSCSYSETVGTRSKYMAVGVYDRHWDIDNKMFVLQSSTLDINNLDHRVIKQGTVVGTGATGWYIVDATTGNVATGVLNKGWYFHLLEDKERCLGDFTLYSGSVLFLTFKPDFSDPCLKGGVSYLYGVYYTSGTSTPKPLFDLDLNGNINEDDMVKDASNNKFSAAVKKLSKAFAGGSVKIKEFKSGKVMGYTPLPDNPPEALATSGQSHEGITTWREVTE